MELNRLCLSCMDAEMLNGRCPKCGSSNEDIAIGDERNLRPRTILHGQYYLGKSIGRGGFGITYIAYDLRNKKKSSYKRIYA